MKSVITTTAVTALFFFSNSVYVNAQLYLSKYEVGLSGGVFVYQGDLTPERLGSYKTLKPQFALHIYRKMNTSFSLRLNINRGKLYGSDSKYANPEFRQQRNFRFTTPVTELSIQGIWSFLEARSPRFSPYIFTGAGVSFLNVNRNWSNFNAAYFGENSDLTNRLNIDASTIPPHIIPVIPVGAGLRYSLNNRFSLIGETSYRFIFTDYLDGFSQAVNPAKKDHYMSHSVGVVYSFNKKDKTMGCPIVKL